MLIQNIGVPLWKINTKNIRTSLCTFRWIRNNSSQELFTVLSRSPRALTDVRASLKQLFQINYKLLVSGTSGASGRCPQSSSCRLIGYTNKGNEIFEYHISQRNWFYPISY